MFCHPALLLLFRLKARAAVRQQVRRLRRPSGWLFMILGLVLMIAWLSSLFVGRQFAPRAPHSATELHFGTEIGLLFLTVMTVVGAFSHRGLYLPKEEIELCFAAPIARSDLVRYRLVVNLMRSLFAGLLFGAMSARRVPVAAFGFVGVLVAMLSLPILGQAAALILGDAENRMARFLVRLPFKLASAAMAAVLVLAIGYLAVGDMDFASANALREWLPRGGTLEDFVALPLVRALVWPFRPWVEMITAGDAATFFPWLAVCLAIAWAGFELTARIPVDFRELSLATSADIAKRLNRMRRGAIGASGARVSQRTVGWRVPWVFGQRSFGAVAWLKLASIVRKARGTLLVSAVIVAGLTVMLAAFLGDPSMTDAVGGAALLAAAGTFYLCAGLRFDFRSDLEQMEQIKAWPVRPAFLFLATILPEVVLVSGVLYAGILARAAITGVFHVAIVGVMALQPLVTLAWVALDNAVFLYSPVRYAPGQEGALQHMGRSLVLMLLRMLLLGVVVVLAGAPAWAVHWSTLELGGTSRSALWMAGTVAWCVLLAVDAVLVWLGGRMLRRFDVARDRGT